MMDLWPINRKDERRKDVDDDHQDELRRGEFHLLDDRVSGQVLLVLLGGRSSSTSDVVVLFASGGLHLLSF